MSKPGGYSSQSDTPSGNKPKSYPNVATNKDLLEPNNPKVDPKDQSAKSQEKDQMVGLNDKFIAFIDKVQNLEQQNKVLDTRLKILKEQEDYQGNVDAVVQQLANELQQQIQKLARDKQKLKQELARCQDEVDQTRNKYQDEIQKKSDLENDFVINKKDVDEGHLAAVDLALELEDLMGELDFLRRGYEEMDDIVLTAEQYEQDVRNVKKEIADMLRLIQRLKAELETLKKQKIVVEKDIEDVEVDGQNALEQARDNIVALEDALRRAKQDMARQVREYQELMNLKLALDIEIATYRKLLEGEEIRMNDHIRHQDIDLPSKPLLTLKPLSLDAGGPPTSPRKRLLIRIEVEAGRVMSKSLHYSDN
ncbi:intermediate filament protein ON3-like isoform X4 [Oncorhynchus clarkii lewisi]|uniref:intermediate filament protein ON3-like isoform X4 n=1 Tax=Oncorhynchus clarkii lewisi TaxID=490388 RepID=UPI0039B83736